MAIGGNIDGTFEISSTTKNAIGEDVKTWTEVQTIHGWLDFISGEANYQNYKSKIEDSTHVFVADYVALDDRIEAESSRLIVNGKRYDIRMIDNPMELNKQLEIFLKFTGGQ